MPEGFYPADARLRNTIRVTPAAVQYRGAPDGPR